MGKPNSEDVRKNSGKLQKRIDRCWCWSRESGHHHWNNLKLHRLFSFFAQSLLIWVRIMARKRKIQILKQLYRGNTQLWLGENDDIFTHKLIKLIRIWRRRLLLYWRFHLLESQRSNFGLYFNAHEKRQRF